MITSKLALVRLLGQIKQGLESCHGEIMSEGKRVVRQYPIEFKSDAVKLLEEQGYTIAEAANSLGIPQANLTKWRKQYREGRLLPGYKWAQPTAGEAELRRLQSEVKRLEMELAIVKGPPSILRSTRPEMRLHRGAQGRVPGRRAL